MVYRHGFNALQINSYVFAKKATEKKYVPSTKGAECELSVDHITITLAIQWRRLGASAQRFASAGPQLQH